MDPQRRAVRVLWKLPTNTNQLLQFQQLCEEVLSSSPVSGTQIHRRALRMTFRNELSRASYASK